MKLLIDDKCNISCLKILAVSEFYNLKIHLDHHLDSDKHCKAPIFTLDDGSTYFSSNATCRYLWNISGHSCNPETDSWLEWECTVLQPSITALLKTTKEDSPPINLRRNLSYLNAVLAKKSYLSGKESADFIDVILWANVYPLYKASLLADVSTLPNLQKWLSNMKNNESLNNAFSRIAGSSKSDLKKNIVCNNNFLGDYFFMPITVPEFISSVEDNPDANESSREPEVTEEDINRTHKSWLEGKSTIPTPKEKVVPVLPKKGERNVLVTSALPYVNNIPHLGNIIGSVLSADVFVRYCRARDYNTLYICGTDEYGTATETKAIASNMTPREICDKYNKLHSDIYNWFNISFDHFGRTTTDKQTKIAQDIFFKLHAQNLIFVDSVEQLFCESCQRFLADRFVEGICPLCSYEDARGDQCDKCSKLLNAADLKSPQCKLCKKTPHLRSSNHLFLDLPKLEAPLKTYLDKVTSEGQWSNTARVISYSWLKEGLKPRCITRDLKWGTPVPLEGFTDKVFYVWYDAPIGYLSITAAYTDEWEQWWKQPDIVQLYQFMAKDNVPFHSIIFPACQLGSKDNYTIVGNLAATEYLNYEDVKFSKSRGVGVFGDDARETGLPSDIWRFYLLYIRPEAQDTYFSWNDLMLKVNSELLNNLGNFINRALSFVSNNFDGIIPEMNLGEGEKLLIAQVDRELKQYIQCMEKTKFRDAIKYMLNISRLGNFYIQSNKPWELVKRSPSDKALAGTVLGLSANICCLLCTLMEPYMPDTCASLKLQLNTDRVHHILIDNFVCLLPQGHKIGKPAPLFKKIDQDLINELKNKYAGRQSEEKEKPKENKTAPKQLCNGVEGSVDLQSLEASVAEQGEKVRLLKAEKANKAEIDKEVAVLLQLKREVLIAKGENPDQLQTKSKNKKKR